MSESKVTEATRLVSSKLVTSKTHRIGILGGTFDPIHIGHLVVATEALHQLALDRVLLMVAGTPWQKVGARNVSPSLDRFAVVEAAVEGLAGIEASRLEIDRGGPTYTIDTAEELLRGNPGSELYLVVGSDVASDLGTWHRANDLPGLVTLVVVDRPGVHKDLDLNAWKSIKLTVPALFISSSDLRRRLRSGSPTDFLIPKRAAEEIRRRNMYAGPDDSVQK